MSWFTRIVNAFRGDRVNREIDEELQSHISEAIEAGRDPAEVQRAFGESLRVRESSRDTRILMWLDSIRADITFGFRQLLKNKVTTGAAILSLALAAGACTSAFRLIDAVLLRPLPVAHPEGLFVLAYEIVDRTGKKDLGEAFDYPAFRELRKSVQSQAELIAISYSGRNQITYGSDQEMERISLQRISGWTFGSFGLKPALGRLLTTSDDLKPGAHPYAVISYDYWKSRFGRRPDVLGRSFRMGNDLYQIVGVSPEGFTGTEPGSLTDIFLPTMTNVKAIENRHWSWFRIWVQVQPDVNPDQVREKLQATFRHYREEAAKEFASTAQKGEVEQFVNSTVSLEPAAAGVSGMQKQYRRSLYALGILVAMVLLIACANVANLMTAQATARAREMALRVSIGAGRYRLVQLVLVESALIALLASVLGGLFAWWATPFVISMISIPENPVRLIMPADWRVLSFAAALATSVTLIFGMVPALRASTVKPASALKGGEEVHTRHRIMNALVAAQVAFCFLVHFVAGLFIATFDRLSSQSTGFSSQNVLVLETVAKKEQPVTFWLQTAEHLKSIQGVQTASLSSWALMSNSAWSSDVWLDGKLAEGQNPLFLAISPNWLETLRIPLTSGRDFRPEDESPHVAIVTESFATRYFDNRNPVGKTFQRILDNKDKKLVPCTIVGVVPDIRYTNMRDAIRPVAFVPFQSRESKGDLKPTDWATLLVRTESNPLLLAGTLRQEVSRFRPELRVSNIVTQRDLVERHTIRERLLAVLSFFFAVVALLLAGIGLYGVLNYSVLQRRREIGIRIALGARPAHVVRRITTQVFGMLLTGSVVGVAAGFASEHYLETLLYQVTVRDMTVITVPAITILTVALLAAVPPVLRAVRIDPASALRTE